MTQDRTSGAAANEWGHATARVIAHRIGAVMTSRTSNEALFEGKKVVIKCAAIATDSVGVTFKMLDRLDSVIAAFQLDDGYFELWSLSADTFRQEMRDTRSKGAAKGKVGLLRRNVFENRGTSLGKVQFNPAQQISNISGFD
jgi:hypothetical protein